MYKKEWKERKFWLKKIKKSEFYKNKKVNNVDSIDINWILVFKEEPYDTKKII